MLEINPLISVIIPTFNRSSTICRAVQSVLDQTYKNIEIIVVDDGSTDDTKNNLKQFSEVIYLKQVNSGVSAARNFGINKSRGEWIAFLDSDDEWMPHKLYAQLEILQARPSLNCIHTEEEWIRNGVRVNQKKKHQKGSGDQFIPSLKLCVIGPSSVMLKRTIFNEIGMFREDYPVCEDYDLWLKLTSIYEVGFVSVPAVKKYGGHPDQLSTRFVAMDYYRIKSIDWIIENRELEASTKELAIKLLTKKAQNLIKGYLKHKNLDNLNQVESILKKY